MKKLPLSLLFSFAFCLSIFAGEVYVFHDSSCMDKLSFKEKTLTADYKLKTTANLISYNIKANEHEYVRLEISPVGDDIVNDMPVDTKNCNELIWDEQFVKEINSGMTEIFVVSLEDGKYRISTVDAASYFFSSEDELAFGNSDFGFIFDQNSFDTNQDLLTYGLKSKVKFNFANNMHCPGEYHFYRSTKGRNLSETELALVPHLGVVRHYTISKKLNRNLREVELQSVNDMPVATYLSQVCNKTTAPIDVAENSEMDKDIMVEKSGVETNMTDSEKDGVILDKPLKVTKNTLASAEEPMKKKLTTENQVCTHIYRNADTGFYYDRDSGKLAEGECGGITYKEGLMQNSDYQSTTATTELVMNIPQEDEFTPKGDGAAVSHEESMTAMAASSAKEAEVKIVKVEPKIIYKPAAPITIDPSIEPQDSKIIIAENTLNNTVSVDCSAAPRTGYHLVKKGETLYKLSNLYNVSIQEIMQWNGLSNSEISVCAQLRVQPQVSLTQSNTSIPANEFVSKGGEAKSTVIGTPTVKRQYHYIAQGETLYAISKKYNVSVAQIKDLNKLKDNYLKPGWRLLIPNSSDQIGTEQINTKKSPIIIEAKPSTDYTPKGGSSMKIPDSSEELLNNYQNQHIYHTVGQNETIEDIALKYGASINSIKLLNEMSEGEVLIPFQKIKVR